MAQRAVALANAAYLKGSVPLVMALKGPIVASGYSDAGKSFDTIYDELRAGAGALAAPKAAREDYKADLVSLASTASGFCGIGGQPKGKTSEGTSNIAFSVIGLACIDAAYVLTHETGHNVGMNHDRYTHGAVDKEPLPSGEQYNFGYVRVQRDVAFRTVMSYRGLCELNKLECPILNSYSSPLIKEQGFPTGVASANQDTTGGTGAMDNLRWMKENYLPVTQYR